MRTIGERIKQKRLEMGLSQADLALLVGKSPGAIGNYESETRQITTDILDFAKALKTSPWVLAHGKEQAGSSLSNLSDSELELILAFRSMSHSEQKAFIDVFQSRMTKPGGSNLTNKSNSPSRQISQKKTGTGS